jgi:hypothetical protein
MDTAQYNVVTPYLLAPTIPYAVRASLETLFSYEISIFPRKNKLISLEKIKIPWKM